MLTMTRPVPHGSCKAPATGSATSWTPPTALRLRARTHQPWTTHSTAPSMLGTMTGLGSTASNGGSWSRTGAGTAQLWITSSCTWRP
ncbi:hypothetical protein DUNSADRAFT_7569 [Dunaliella salina]|uniref:Uncharacterized protein n=1 Tax=Dunaliella salina TaxID=3046 RepID=A0ABQ7GL47_DUNSA|nr:hypothetical protein DUNSADRAFT_7569 [Dunaliella salina]|eukprot:KAF5835337.1 hypothetical protein DUNSADRAFT_7569 [Dunaliella salina]